MEVIDIQAVRDCLAEVSDCEDKQYAIALLEWAIGKRTFDLDKHDSELLDKVAEKLKECSIEIDTSIPPFTERMVDVKDIDEVITDMKLEVEK